MKLFANLKIWIIAAIVAVLVGAVFIAVFGLNETPDFKSAYEVSVSVDQNVQGSGEITDAAAKAYFKDKGYTYSSYATQETANGATYIYKFGKAGDISETELETSVKAALDANADLSALDLKVNADYKQTATSADEKAGMTVLACALCVLAAFIIAFFIVKTASALTVVCNAVITAVVFVMLVAITRIPARPDFFIELTVGAVLSVIMTFVITCRYKELLKLEGKSDIKAIAESGLNSGALRLYFIAGAGALIAIALAATGSVYLLFTGLKILIATCSAFIVSCVATPALWTLFKNVKAKG